jgi:hypothetical protein
VDYQDWLICKETAVQKRICDNTECRALMAKVLENGTITRYVCYTCGLEASVDKKTGEVKTFRLQAVKNTKRLQSKPNSVTSQ